MRNNFGPRQFIILAGLLAVILLPRLCFGFQALAQGEKLRDQGELARAATSLSAAAERIPWRNDLWGAAGQLARDSGDLDRARLLFEKGIADHALSGPDWVAYGDTLQVLGEDDAAILAWTESLKHAASADAHLRLGQAAIKAKAFSQAIEHLQEATLLSPENPGMAYQLGLMLTATSPEEALPWLMQAAGLDPGLEPKVSMLRAIINQAILTDAPAYRLAMAGRGLAALGEWVLAEEAFGRAVQSDPGYGEAWAWLGEARQQTGQDGREELIKAIALAPQSASVHALEGLYWLRQGKTGMAQAAYLRAAALEPENAFWQIALGDAAAAGDKLGVALAYYQKATELAPQEAATWRALALFCLDHETDVQNTGLQAARQFLRLAPDDWLSHDIAGRVATRVGEEVEAEFQLLRAIELDPEQPAPYLHLGLAYLEFEQASLAYSRLMDAMTLDPEGPYGWQARRLLERYFP